MNLNWYASLPWFAKTNKVHKILFVCSGNACRSPSAEYFFRSMASWFSGVTAFSRGTNVEKLVATLRGKGLPEHIIEKELALTTEVRKVIGNRTAEFMKKHKATQLSGQDIHIADLVLTMERSLRDQLRAEFPAFAYKIFTLKGFINQTENYPFADLDIPNPFKKIPAQIEEGIKVRSERGELAPRYAIPYHNYIQNYVRVVEGIRADVRRLIEIIYSINRSRPFIKKRAR